MNTKEKVILASKAYFNEYTEERKLNLECLVTENYSAPYYKIEEALANICAIAYENKKGAKK